jgi:calcineurin-like phosphoesterase family protein
LAKKKLLTDLQKIQASFPESNLDISRPESEFPELFVDIDDNLDTIVLAPLYDVHIGNHQFDQKLFLKHRKWIAETPNVVSWLGGDMIENITNQKMGHTHLSNEEQIDEATKLLAPMQHKILFSLPGNHEARTYAATHTSTGKRLADNLQVQYFNDYCFATIRWRGNAFRVLSHHGAGGAQTAGAQRNAARKELLWAKPDILWTGHLHATLADTVYLTDYDQKTGRMYERGAVVLISPSYLTYFGGYAAAMRLTPGLRGLSVCELQPDGRIDLNLHARGRRL